MGGGSKFHALRAITNNQTMNKHKAHFYSHLVQFEELFVELDELKLSDDERHHLGQLIDSNLHHTIVDAILSELPETEKENFLRLLNQGQHDKIWEHLNSKASGIEETIKVAAKDITQKMHKDIIEVKRLKGKTKL